VPAAALRFNARRKPAQVRPEDRHFVEGLPSTRGGRAEAQRKREGGAARNRQRRTVWVQDGSLLRAVSVTLG